MTTSNSVNGAGSLNISLFSAFAAAALKTAKGILNGRTVMHGDKRIEPRAGSPKPPATTSRTVTERTSIGDAGQVKPKATVWRHGKIPGYETIKTAVVQIDEPQVRESAPDVATPAALPSPGKAVSTRDISRLKELNHWRHEVALAVAKNAKLDLSKFPLTPEPVLAGGERHATQREIAQGAAYPGRLIKDLINAGMGRREAQEAFHRMAIHQLNHREWPVLSRALNFDGGTFTSVQTPAAHLTPLKGGYQASGVNGICSSERDRNDHAVNLMQTRLVDNDGKELFAGVRSATIGADIKDAAGRKHASHVRAGETIKAALDLRPDLVAAAKAGKVPVLRMTSTSLMSPSPIATKEAAYLKTQVDAWQEINQASQKNGYIFVQGFGDSPIRVKVEILPFSVGVNSFAFLGPSSLQGLIGGWDTSDRINDASLGTLMGWTQDFLRSNPQSEHFDRVITLRREIREIVDNKLHHQDGGDPYKLASRLQELAYRIGAVPAFNCKSGKDRTGQCDVEVKSAIMLERMKKGDAPKPNAVLTPHQQNVLRTTQLESGTLEITKSNTGAMGLMINSGGPFAASNAKRTGAGGEEDGLARALHD